MGKRNMLPVGSTAEFLRWLEKKGWRVDPPRGEYEVIRMVKKGEDSIIIHFRDRTKTGYFTVHGKGERLCRQWLKAREEERKSRQKAMIPASP